MDLFSTILSKLKMLKYSSFKYSESNNLGDEIQSLAIEQYIPRVDAYINRDSLKSATSDNKYIQIMNGWFSHKPSKCFPPSQSIKPVFIGFHMTDWNETVNEFLTPEGVEYFKRNEPIGCRDKKTMELLISKGINAFYSKCLTITFPKRDSEPKEGKVFLVNTDRIPIPDNVRKNAITASHIMSRDCSHNERMEKARQLLARYKNEARLVITTRLHCALPCIAMGIPVIFFGDPNDYRVSVLNDLGISINPIPGKIKRKIYKTIKKTGLGSILSKPLIRLFYPNIDWAPKAVNIEKTKQDLITVTKELIEKKATEVDADN